MVGVGIGDEAATSNERNTVRSSSATLYLLLLLLLLYRDRGVSLWGRIRLSGLMFQSQRKKEAQRDPEDDDTRFGTTQEDLNGARFREEWKVVSWEASSGAVGSLGARTEARHTHGVRNARG